MSSYRFNPLQSADGRQADGVPPLRDGGRFNPLQSADGRQAIALVIAAPSRFNPLQSADGRQTFGPGGTSYKLFQSASERGWAPDPNTRRSPRYSPTFQSASERGWAPDLGGRPHDGGPTRFNPLQSADGRQTTHEYVAQLMGKFQSASERGWAPDGSILCLAEADEFQSASERGWAPDFCSASGFRRPRFNPLQSADGRQTP